MTRGGQKHPGTTPTPRRERVAWRRVTDGGAGEGRGDTRGGGGAAASLASHPLQEGPGLFHSALALLLKFQLCAQPSWLTASHVPALGWAAGSGARGGHMAEKPGNAEQSLDGRLAQGHERCQYQPGSALSTAWRLQPLALINSQGVPAGKAWCWTPREPGTSHGLAGSSPSTWTAASHCPYERTTGVHRRSDV